MANPLIPVATYEISLLQSRAYRKLNTQLTQHLGEWKLTVPEWGALGTIKDSRKLRMQQLAQLLDVEPPFVAKISRSLEAKGLATITPDTTDNRVRHISLTAAGTQLVNDAESKLRQHLSTYLKSVGAREFAIHMRVMKKIANLA